MSNLIKIVKGCDNPLRRGDVVFVHGAHGGWGTFPHWLGEDIGSVGIWLLQYEGEVLRGKEKRISLTEQAINALTEFRLHGLGDRPMVLVAHSLGGLLVKKMLLLTARQPDWATLVETTKGIAFISTPHYGLLVPALVRVVLQSRARELEMGKGQLEELNGEFRKIVNEHHIKVIVYYELKRTKGLRLVNPKNANPKIDGVEPIPINLNHELICKPQSRDDQVYQGVRAWIRECIADRLVFVSYSHADEPWKERIVKRLQERVSVEGNCNIEFWDDSRVEIGQSWREAVMGAIESADLAVLLVTADFLGSPFITTSEVPQFLVRRAKLGMPVFPVILSYCAWQDVGWLSEIQVFPRGRHLAQGTDSEVEQDLDKLAAAIASELGKTPPAA